MSTSTRVSKVGAIVVCVGLALAPASASAQDRLSAEELFQLGKGAMARQEYTKACGYFDASLKADFALGTLLNLALCHEQTGKIASAWAEFRTLEDRARRANPPQTDRSQFARAHADALRPRLSRVRIALSPEASKIAGLTVTIDGAPAAPELFDAGLPVDPGSRKIAASAPEHEEWSQVVAVEGERQELKVTVPALQRVVTKPVPPPPAPSVDLSEIERISAERSQRTVGFIVGAIGAASLATGAVFGVLAIAAADDAKACKPICYTTNIDGSPNPALRSAEDAYDRSNMLGWVSNVTLATGVVGLGVGAYLVLTARKTPGTAIAAAPLPGGAAFSFGGSL